MARRGRRPHGRVRGEGFVEPGERPGDIPLVKWATRYVDRLTGIDIRTREDYHREIRLHGAPDPPGPQGERGEKGPP